MEVECDGTRDGVGAGVDRFRHLPNEVLHAILKEVDLVDIARYESFAFFMLWCFHI